MAKTIVCALITIVFAGGLIGCGGGGGKLPNSNGPIQPITIKAQFPSTQGRVHDTITSAWLGVTGPGMSPIIQEMIYDALHL